MPYSQDSLENILAGREKVLKDLKELTISFIRLSESLKKDRAKEYLMHGLCRRLQMIAHCIDKIFSIFPPNRQKLLGREELFDVQTNLHAIVINLYGVLDNFAWIFVYENDLMPAIGRQERVGLFKLETRKHLPRVLIEYIDSCQRWHADYIKRYRDALAHRIPLFIAPFILKIEDERRWNELDAQMAQCLEHHEFEKLEKLRTERDLLGIVSDTFMHSFSEENSKPICLHPQLISDASTIVEFGNLYVKNFFVKD